ncbi:alpha/beta hydrolase [Bradyrhizobium liaoningense]|nr:alpha/beta hydrolase [Bradyrhizobium liaoningense]
MNPSRSIRRARRSMPYASGGRTSLATASTIAIAALAITALLNRHLSKKAERDNPPSGRFVEVDGVRLHYLERGTGDVIVLLHGNGSMAQDFESSGLVDLAAKEFRVIAFDRPGFGHSNRPHGKVWTPDVQADLIAHVLAELGISKAIVLGHSWGASVAAAMGIKHPALVRALVLASGYYYPTLRLDAIASLAPALPLVGDILSHTVSPLFNRAIWPMALRKIFGPQPVPEKFGAFPKEMALRPSQIRASSEEAAMMVPDAFAMRGQYADLKMPVVIVAGDQDRLIDIEAQSARLHSAVQHSSLHRIRENGHMIQQTATDQVMSAIREAASGSASRAAAE